MKIIIQILYGLTFLTGAMKVEGQNVASSKFTLPLKDWELQKLCRPAKDGVEILNLISAGQLKDDLVVMRLVDAKKSFPPYLLGGAQPSNSSRGRPTVTSAVVQKVWASKRPLLELLPEKFSWEESQFVAGMQAPRFPVMIALTQAGMDLYAESWELLVQFHPGRMGRACFSNPLALPQGWWRHFESAITWRNQYSDLLSKAILSPNEIERLRSALSHLNPIVRKLASHRLLKSLDFKEEDINFWFSSEKTMHDFAVSFQMIFDAGREGQLLRDLDWIFQGGENLWCGALLGFTLKFVTSEDAVESMEKHQWRLAEDGSGAGSIPQVVINQPSYAYLKKLSEGKVVNDALQTSHHFSFVASLLRSSKILSH